MEGIVTRSNFGTVLIMDLLENKSYVRFLCVFFLIRSWFWKEKKFWKNFLQFKSNRIKKIFLEVKGVLIYTFFFYIILVDKNREMHAVVTHGNLLFRKTRKNTIEHDRLWTDRIPPFFLPLKVRNSGSALKFNRASQTQY